MHKFTHDPVWMLFGVLGFLALMGIAVIAAPMTTRPTVEDNTGEVTGLEDFEPVDFKNILDREMPYIPYN